jgi:hypothetical protein
MAVDLSPNHTLLLHFLYSLSAISGTRTTESELLRPTLAGKLINFLVQQQQFSMSDLWLKAATCIAASDQSTWRANSTCSAFTTSKAIASITPAAQRQRHRMRMAVCTAPSSSNKNNSFSTTITPSSLDQERVAVLRAGLKLHDRGEEKWSGAAAVCVAGLRRFHHSSTAMEDEDTNNERNSNTGSSLLKAANNQDKLWVEIEVSLLRTLATLAATNANGSGDDASASLDLSLSLFLGRRKPASVLHLLAQLALQRGKVCVALHCLHSLSPISANPLEADLFDDLLMQIARSRGASGLVTAPRSLDLDNRLQRLAMVSAPSHRHQLLSLLLCMQIHQQQFAAAARTVLHLLHIQPLSLASNYIGVLKLCMGVLNEEQQDDLQRRLVLWVEQRLREEVVTSKDCIEACFALLRPLCEYKHFPSGLFALSSQRSLLTGQYFLWIHQLQYISVLSGQSIATIVYDSLSRVMDFPFDPRAALLSVQSLPICDAATLHQSLQSNSFRQALWHLYCNGDRSDREAMLAVVEGMCALHPQHALTRDLLSDLTKAAATEPQLATSLLALLLRCDALDDASAVAKAALSSPTSAEILSTSLDVLCERDPSLQPALRSFLLSHLLK